MLGGTIIPGSMRPTTRYPRMPTPSTRARRLLAGLVLAGSMLAVTLPAEAVGAAPAGYSTDQVQVRELVNASRAANGLRALAFHQVFANKAQTWAGVLADCECLWHRNSPYGAGQGWFAVAESLGRGNTPSQAHEALLSASTDRARILTRRFTHIGTGVARADNGEVYVVLAFMDRTRTNG